MTVEEIKRNILDDPMDRLPIEMRNKFKNSEPFIDIHTHIFTLNDVPSKFLGIRIPMSRRFIGGLSGVINKFSGKKNRDDMKGIDYFLTTMKDRSSNAIYRRMNKVYYLDKHPDAIYGILTMDMTQGIDGGSHNSIWTQFSTVAMIRNLNPDKIIPFACIDPRRDKAMDLFEQMFNSKMPYKYFGLKVYPSLGYLPTHPTLMKMLEVCAAKGIPVLTHCSSGSTHGSLKRKDNVPGTFVNDKGEHIQNADFKTRVLHRKDDYRDFFNRPQNWEPVLEKFPNLKLNIAHFGGDVAWEDYLNGKNTKWIDTILGFIDKYDNVYADFSYTLYSQRYSKALKKMMAKNEKLASRTLFGSDYYMLVIEDNYKTIFERFKKDMGPEVMKRIAVDNNREYLIGPFDTSKSSAT